jgi:predicted phage-related endonuclease
MSPDTTETEQRPIGAASVAGILGISPYQSPWSVWARLVGLPVPDPSNQDRLDAGTDAEAFLAAQFNRHMERGGLACEQKQVDLEHADYPWLRGRGDGLVTGIEGPDIVGYCGGWEAKTSTDLRPWDEIPPHYAAQCQTYMLLSGYDNWWVTVGFGNWKVRHYAVLADPEDQATIVGETERFWREHVLTGVAPDVDGTPLATRSVLPSDIWATPATSCLPTGASRPPCIRCGSPAPTSRRRNPTLPCGKTGSRTQCAIARC